MNKNIDDDTSKDEKFILMNLHEESATHIAEVLKNKTAKRILDYMGDVREVSEKDISDKLGIPINTAEYNLKKLIKAGFVKKTGNFFWSVKGKKIPMYKLTRKHIVISPKKRPDLTSLRSILPVFLVALITIVAVSIIFSTNILINEQDGVISGTGELKQFSTLSELQSYLEKNADEGSSGIFDAIPGIAEFDGAVSESANVARATDSSASEFSTTNIQVKGVDEPDIVKNDGKYIYLATNNKVYIVNAYPAENMEILSEIEHKKIGVNQIFINENKLIVFGNSWSVVPYEKEGDPVILDEVDDEETGSLRRVASNDAVSEIAVSDALIGTSIIRPASQKTVVFIYDTQDKENPELIHTFEIDGNYNNARMIGDFVYLISTKYANVRNPLPPVYEIDGVETEIDAREVFYFDYPDRNFVFTTVSSIDIDNGKTNNKVYLTGGAQNIYVSEDNIYLTHRKQQKFDFYLEKFVREVALPLLPDEKDEEINKILESNDNDNKKLSLINRIVYDYSFKIKGEDKEDYDKRLLELTEKFEISISKINDMTIIHKINIEKNNIDYIGNGEVPGNILNQFSMDEYKENLRIATTTGNTWRGTSLNHVYVLDEDLEIIGSVEDIAQGERIFSARFLGSRAYMVTFRQVDPFYVINLENPKKPEILGYLKIPGYSSYLQPYDENHIIGLGMDATDEGRVQGVKIAIFDVSDVTKPKELSNFKVNEEFDFRNRYVWSSSEAVHDHKAFLFDKEKELLVLPVSYSINYNSNNDRRWEYFQGAYVFRINLDEGIVLRDKISHFEDEERWRFNVRRSLFMDDILYTISNLKIKANDLFDLKTINQILFEDNFDDRVDYEIALDSVEIEPVETDSLIRIN